EDPAARRGNGHLAQPVVLRLQDPFVVMKDLRPEEGTEQEHDHTRHDDRRGATAPNDIVRVKTHAGRGSIRGRSIVRTRAPASAVTADDNGDQTRICIARSAPARRCPTTTTMTSNTHFPTNRNI